MRKQAKALRPGKEAPALQQPTFDLIRTSLELAMTVATEAHDEDEFGQRLKKVERAYKRVLTVYGRMLPDT